jgi:prolyl-tRNA synthetase
LQKVHEGLYNKALARRESMTYDAHTLDEMIDIANNKPGLVRAMWCGDLSCEEAIKEKAGLTSRCMPFEQEHLDDVCPCCGKPAKTMVYWGKQY